MENKFSPIWQWLYSGTNLHSLLNLNDATSNPIIGGFLTLHEPIPLHESLTLKPESLKESWNSSRKYIEDCKQLLELNDEEMECLDRYERELILEEIGMPQPLAYPLYIMTVRSKDVPERVVYIGKTSSNNMRFKGGHTAITKLHAPQYNNLEKKLYIAYALLITKENYLPLEWVSPLSRSESILNTIEAQLIHHFQPELNTTHKKTKHKSKFIQLHIQNFHDTQFLNDEMVEEPI